MLQVSRRADYATRIMITLGLQEGGTCLSARVVSQRASVPKAFLHKITANLVKANLVRTFVGPAGGLALARPAAQINMLQIMEATDGPVCLNRCMLRPGECHRDLICPAHDFWGRLQAEIVRQLREARLDLLVSEARDLIQHPRRRQNVPYLVPEQHIEVISSDGQ